MGCGASTHAPVAAPPTPTPAPTPAESTPAELVPLSASPVRPDAPVPVEPHANEEAELAPVVTEVAVEAEPELEAVDAPDTEPTMVAVEPDASEATASDSVSPRTAAEIAIISKDLVDDMTKGALAGLATPQKEAPSTDDAAEVEPENGNSVIAEEIEADASAWAALNAAGTAPPAGSSWTVGFIADQDQASATVASDGAVAYESSFSTAALTYDAGANAYTLGELAHNQVATSRGDQAGRGGEFSALEVFGGKLLTFDDRTGAVDEIVRGEDGYSVQPLLDERGEPVVCSLGDGSKPGKGLKCEWATMRDGALIVGSTGKERTDEDGNVVHEGEMWVKAIHPQTLAVTSVDARPLYTTMRTRARCPHGAGYAIHEAVRWNETHGRWFFMPRKLSREAYDEATEGRKCVSLMMAADGDGEDAKVIVAEPSALPALAMRGVSDFFFLPGDKHIFVIRTEETEDNVLRSYASVIELEGNPLMPETLIGDGKKFEGACLIDEWLDSEGAEVYAPTCAQM